MTKTVLVNGSLVTPDYLNDINGVDANTGHKHDGLDEDGSVPKIILANGAQVTGELPIENMGAVQKNVTLEISTDAGSTYPITTQFDISRIGNVINILLLENILEVMPVSSALFIRPQGGGSWDGNIFPLTDVMFSCPFSIFDSLDSSILAGYMEYTDINTPIEVRPQGGGIFGLGATVSWSFGTFGQLVRKLV